MNARRPKATNKKRRVLFPFVGDTIGGNHISASELAHDLDRTRFELIFSVHRDGKLRSFLECRGLAVERAPDLVWDSFSGNRAQDLAAILLAVFRLSRFLRRLRIDIVHTHDARMHFLWGLAARFARMKFVLHMRGRVQSRINYSCRFADSLVAISEYSSELVPYSAKAKVHVVRNPVRPPSPEAERDHCRMRLLATANAPPNTKTVLGFVANFMHRKRPLVFVEVAARLRERFGNKLFFPMFGEIDGTRDRALSDCVRTKIREYGLAKNCVLMGQRFPIEPWIMGCDILVAPAVGESFGRTLVEAMLCGTPVVATDDGGHREIIRHGETGLLARADDVAAFVDAVAGLLERPRMADSIASAAKSSALEKYSVHAHVERIQSIYDSLER